MDLKEIEKINKSKIKEVNEYREKDKQRTPDARISICEYNEEKGVYLTKSKETITDEKTGKKTSKNAWLSIISLDCNKDFDVFFKCNQLEQFKSMIIFELDIKDISTNKKITDKKILKYGFEALKTKLIKAGITFRAKRTEDYRAVVFISFWKDLPTSRAERFSYREKLFKYFTWEEEGILYESDLSFRIDKHCFSIGIHPKTKKEIIIDSENDFDKYNNIEEVKDIITNSKDKLHNEEELKKIGLDVPNIDRFKTGITQDNVFYFGTITYNKDNLNPLQDVFLTSDKKGRIKIYSDENKIKEELKVNYRFKLDIEAVDNGIKRGTIEKLVKHKPKNLKDIFESIYNLNKHFIWYPNDLTQKEVALDIIASYFLPCFKVMGRSFIEAEKGSGKTNQCTLIKLLAFNSIMTADISPSSFFRLMESSCGTLIIDDFDSLNDELKKNISHYFKIGYKDNSKTIRRGENNKGNDTFRTFGHLVMNNTSGIDDISADRSKFWELLKTDDKNIANKNIDETNTEFRRITDELFIYALHNWHKVKLNCENFKSDKLNGRRLEIYLGILTLAEMISKELREELEEYFLEREEQKALRDDNLDFEYFLFEAFAYKPKGFVFSNKELLDIITKRLYENNFGQEIKIRSLSIWLGRKLKTLLSIFKSKMIKGLRHIELINEENFYKYVKNKEWCFEVLGHQKEIPKIEKEEKVGC